MGMLGDMVVSFSADLSNLTSGVSQAKADISSIGDTAQATGEQTSGGFLGAIGSVMSFGAQIGQTIFGVQQLYNGAVNLASGLLQPAATAETTELSFENMLHSTKAAHEEMVSLNTYAASTPMQTQWVDEAAAKMLAFGIANKDVIPDITAIGDNLSALGNLSDASLQSIVDIFGKINTEGKLTGGTMMELSRWGIPAWQSLSQAMGLSIPELQKMVSKGLIPAGEGIKALREGMEKTFGGGMAKQAQTAAGLLSTLASNAQIAMAAFGGPLLKQAEQGLSAIGATLASSSFQNFAVNVGTKIGDAISLLARGAQQAGQFLSSTLLPPLEHLGSALAPIIGPMVQWVMQSGVLRDVLMGVVGVVALTVMGLGRLIDGVANVVNFFRQNQVAADALIGVLAGIGAVIAITVVPGLVAAGIASVAAFGAWAIGAAAAAIATLAATWPILAIGAVIALVVTGIVLAIQHWGQITAWLKGVWAAIATWFSGLWQGMLAGIQSFVGWVQGAWNGLLSFLQTAAKIGLQVLFLIFFGPIVAIVDLFKWLYDHNTYFQKLVDAIKSIITAGLAWLTSTWQKFTSWLGGLWEGLSQKASSVFGTIAGAVRDKSSQAGSWLQTTWTNATTATTNFLTQIGNLMIQGWDFISNVFSQAWSTYIQPPLQGLWDSISSWFTDLANMALQSGSNFITMLVQGISSGAGQVWDAVKSVASNIWSALGFHSPAKAGPASDADKWMPNLINMFVSGLNAGVPKIAVAAQNVATPLQQQFASPSRAGAGVVPIVVAGSSGSGSSAGPHTTILEIDGREFGRVMAPHVGDAVVQRIRLTSRGK